MAGVLQHLRSSTLNKRPNPASMVDGQLAINYASGSPGAFFKDTNGNLVKVGPVHVGSSAPNVSPASGGTAGNSLGEQWLDTSGGTYVFKIWDGGAWRSEAGEFVNVTGDTMTGALGIIAGSASTPGLFFSGDSNTGLYSPGADQAAISTSSVGRVFVSPNGYIGIGNSAPESAAITPGLVLGDGTDNKGLMLYGTSGSQQNIAFTDTAATQQGLIQYDHGSDYMRFFTASSERLRITSAGLVGVGTSSPGEKLTVAGNISLSAAQPYISLIDSVWGSGSTFRSGVNTLGTAIGDYQLFNAPPGKGFAFAQNNATNSLVIDSSNRVLVGTSTARGNFFNTTGQESLFEIESLGGPVGAFTLNSASAAPGSLVIAKSRGATAGSNVIAQNNDGIGRLSFQASDGSEMVEAANIEASVDGTPGDNDMPGRLVFSTTADGASSPSERMRITSGGGVRIAQGATDDPGASNIAGIGFGPSGFVSLSRTQGAALLVNRTTDDGALVAFRQDGTDEGSITVSGTTVSYNGAHLSRWSQLPSGAERTEILRGSVLSNIDEMCEWGDEGNEQLNRMKVSDVEGDKNVSGVFQAWDDDDDTYTNDFYCAMTGDFIIRIAQGVTVERGDLLMSAGDGTAKPQDDDIIRSKTIAKVTSTNVSCTYADGSYCVPCVLMAC